MMLLDQILRRFLASCAIAAVVVLVSVSPHPQSPGHRCGHALGRAPVTVQSAAFGVESWSEDAGYVFTETDRLVFEAGARFGWRIRLNNPADSVLLREELVLPASPLRWTVSPSTQIAADGQRATTTKVVWPAHGWISNGWTLTEGDPLGPYETRVFLNGVLVRTFRFDVAAPADKAGAAPPDALSDAPPAHR